MDVAWPKDAKPIYLQGSAAWCETPYGFALCFVRADGTQRITYSSVDGDNVRAECARLAVADGGIEADIRAVVKCDFERWLT